MLSIIVLMLLFIVCLWAMSKTKKLFPRFAALAVFSLLIMESIVYGYFLYSVYKGNCFLLIGNQKVLDTLIEMRLTHAIYFSEGKKNFLFHVNNELGYTIGKDKDTGIYKSNFQRMRSDKEYTLLPTDKLRVAAFGDSFVFCDGEKNADTWEQQLEDSVGNLEVMNFGVSGYGLGQSYLRYLQDGIKFQPDVIFFNYVYFGDRDQLSPIHIAGSNNLRNAEYYRVNFWIENNELYNKSVKPFDFFSPTFQEKFIYKPLGINQQTAFWRYKIFSATNLGLFLKQWTIRQAILKHKQSLTVADQEALNLKILENIIKIARRQGTVVIFFFSDKLKNLPVAIRQLFEKSSNVIYVNAAEEIRNRYIANRFEEKKIETLNATHHYNRWGNQLYAETVLKALISLKWDTAKRRFAYDKSNKVFHLKADMRKK